MNDIKHIQNDLSPRIRQMLAAYGVMPKRDAESARRTQAAFFAELDTMFVTQSTPLRIARRSIFFSCSRGFHQRMRKSIIYLFPKRSVLSIATVFIVLSIYLSGSIGIVAYAASSSLPGETLYSIKTTGEAMRANLTMDSAEQAQLYLDFARRRLIEMQSLVVKGRYNQIHQAAREYEKDVQRALSAIENLSQTDRTEALVLNKEAADILQIYSGILSQMLILIPEDQQPDIQSAIAVSEAAASSSDHHGITDPIPTPTLITTPTELAPASTKVESTPTAALENNNNRTSDGDRGANNSGSDDANNGSGANNGGNSTGDDDGEGEDGGDG